MDPERLQRAQAALKDFIYIPALRDSNEETNGAGDSDLALSPAKPAKEIAAYRPWDRQDLHARLRTFKVAL